MNESSTSPQADVKLTRVFSRTPSSWDPQDDLLLRHLKEEQKLGWKEIASHFAHRTPNACQFRWRRLRSGSLKSSGSGSSSGPSGSTGPNDKDKIEKNESSTSNSTPAASSLKNNSASPSTSPDPITNASYNKFQSIPSQIKPNSSPIVKNMKPLNVEVDYNKFSFNSIVNPIGTVSSKAKGSSANKRRNSSKIEPNDVFAYSSSSSISSDDEDSNKPNAIKWTSEEDELILTRKERQLSFAELSILLQRRSEFEINDRILHLEKISKFSSNVGFQSPNKIQSKLQQQQQQFQQPLQQRHSHKSLKKSIRSSSFTIPIPDFANVSPQPLTNQHISRARSRSRSFSTRSKSFSLVTPPYFTTAPTNFQERYYSQRKNSISSHHIKQGSIPTDRKNSIIGVGTTNGFLATNYIKPRSNSMKYSSLNAGNASVNEAIDDSVGYSSDEEEFVSYNTSNIRVEPLIRSNGAVPNMGTLLNEI